MASVQLQLQRIADKTGENMRTLIRETNVELSSQIVQSTPVRDGYLRGGWVAQNDGEPSKSPLRKDKSGALALNMVSAVASQTDIGEEYFFVNALPYAKRIEDGWSKKQAPQGMVKISIREIQGIVKERAARLP